MAAISAAAALLDSACTDSFSFFGAVDPRLARSSLFSLFSVVVFTAICSQKAFTCSCCLTGTAPDRNSFFCAIRAWSVGPKANSGEEMSWFVQFSRAFETHLAESCLWCVATGLALDDPQQRIVVLALGEFDVELRESRACLVLLCGLPCRLLGEVNQPAMKMEVMHCE